MSRCILKGSTDQSVIIRIIDSTDGTPETGVVYNTSGIAMWYRREGATVTAITEATLAAADSAHSDGGIIHLSDGYYRLDLPDAAVATGVASVMVGGAVTGMIVIGTEIQLVNYNPQDGVRLGLTAMPNAAADAAGGLPISDAGGLDMDAKLANTNEVTAARMGALTDWINGGRLDLIIDAIQACTDRLTAARAGVLDDWLNAGRLDNILDARASQTSVDTIDGIVDTIVARVIGTIAAGTHNPQSGDAYARLGAPAGASVSADVAAVKSDSAAILVDTGTTLDGRIPAALVGGRIDASVGAMASGVVTAAAVATGAFDADALAADAASEIAAAVQAAVASGTTTWNEIMAALVSGMTTPP